MPNTCLRTLWNLPNTNIALSQNLRRGCCKTFNLWAIIAHGTFTPAKTTESTPLSILLMYLRSVNLPIFDKKLISTLNFWNQIFPFHQHCTKINLRHLWRPGKSWISAWLPTVSISFWKTPGQQEKNCQKIGVLFIHLCLYQLCSSKDEKIVSHKTRPSLNYPNIWIESQ